MVVDSLPASVPTRSPAFSAVAGADKLDVVLTSSTRFSGLCAASGERGLEMSFVQNNHSGQSFALMKHSLFSEESVIHPSSIMKAYTYHQVEAQH